MDVRNIIALSMVKGIGPAFFKRNLNRILRDETCVELVNEYKPDQAKYFQSYLIEADEIILCCKKNGINIISIVSTDYPKTLMELSDPPTILYTKGNLALLNRCLAIIGTRKSTQLGNKIAEKLGCYFSKDFAICNGLVEGIDEHSIYINGNISSNVVGIISGGLCYKQTCSNKHITTIENVLSAGGLIISEFPPMQKEDAFSGSKASRIQAGLSNGLILVQSSVDGGSKYTIAAFSKLFRPLGVIHYPSSEEYKSDTFSGNRLIVEKREKGVAEMIGLKTESKVNLESITIIESRGDYKNFENRMMKNLQFNGIPFLEI